MRFLLKRNGSFNGQGEATKVEWVKSFREQTGFNLKTALFMANLLESYGQDVILLDTTQFQWDHEWVRDVLHDAYAKTVGFSSNYFEMLPVAKNVSPGVSADSSECSYGPVDTDSYDLKQLAQKYIDIGSYETAIDVIRVLQRVQKRLNA